MKISKLFLLAVLGLAPARAHASLDDVADEGQDYMMLDADGGMAADASAQSSDPDVGMGDSSSNYADESYGSMHSEADADMSDGSWYQSQESPEYGASYDRESEVGYSEAEADSSHEMSDADMMMPTDVADMELSYDSYGSENVAGYPDSGYESSSDSMMMSDDSGMDSEYASYENERDAGSPDAQAGTSYEFEGSEPSIIMLDEN